MQWDIWAEGRAWTRDEGMARYALTPEKMEMVDGKLLGDDDQRLALLALLLENTGRRRCGQAGATRAYGGRPSRI